MNSITNTGTRRLTIGQLSASSGVNIETIRYYERIGVLDVPPRTQGGHRSYDRADIGRLQFVRRARELGFGIDYIRTLLTLAQQGGTSCRDVRAIAAAHLADIRGKLNDLQKLEAILASTVAECESRRETTLAPVCPLIEVLQSQARDSPTVEHASAP